MSFTMSLSFTMTTELYHFISQKIVYVFTLKRHTRFSIGNILSRVYHLAYNRIHLVSDKLKSKPHVS